MIRGTTTLANTSEWVTPGRVRSLQREPSFEFNIEKYSKAGPSACVRQHQEALSALVEFGRLTEGLNPMVVNGSRTGVIVTGVAWNYLEEVLHAQGLKPSTLKLGVAHPLPLAQIRAFLSGVDTAIVLEELEPLVEETVRALRAEVDHPVRVIGKIRGPLSRCGDRM